MQGSRPVWGCLDAQELRDAAAGHIEDPAIREHLSGCRNCRHSVRELREAVGRPVRVSRSSYRRSLFARPAFWLLLLLLALGAVGWVMYKRRPPPPPAEAVTVEPPPPAAPPPERPKRRARPRPSGAPPADVDIVGVINKNQTGVRMCYERALKRDPRLSLRVDVRVNVSAAGVVDRVALDGLPDDVPLANCIRNTIKTWHFPRAPAAYDTTFPLRLQQSRTSPL